MSVKPEKPQFTILPDNLVQELGLVTTAVWAMMKRYSQMDSGRCTASHRKLGKRLGLSGETVRLNIAKLIPIGLVRDETPDLSNHSHTYSVLESTANLVGTEELPTNLGPTANLIGTSANLLGSGANLLGSKSTVHIRVPSKRTGETEIGPTISLRKEKKSKPIKPSAKQPKLAQPQVASSKLPDEKLKPSSAGASDADVLEAQRAAPPLHKEVLCKAPAPRARSNGKGPSPEEIEAWERAGLHLPSMTAAWRRNRGLEVLE